MHPELRYLLMQARVADLHRQAQRDALARAARQARYVRKHQSGHPARGLPAVTARRVLTILSARST